MNCPNCGQALVEDALSGEWRPCTMCGAVSEQPDASHAHHGANVRKRKRYEVAALVIVIVLGIGYFMVNRENTSVALAVPETLETLSARVEAMGFDFVDEAVVLGRQMTTHVKSSELLRTSVHLFSIPQSTETETIAITVSVPANADFPTDDIVEELFQGAFDDVVPLGESLVTGSTPALSLASSDLSPSDRSGRRYDEGVALMNIGWTVTYIAYREYEESDDSIPMLVFLYQFQGAGIEPELEEFNVELYKAIDLGNDVANELRLNR